MQISRQPLVQNAPSLPLFKSTETRHAADASHILGKQRSAAAKAFRVVGAGVPCGPYKQSTAAKRKGFTKIADADMPFKKRMLFKQR